MPKRDSDKDKEVLELALQRFELCVDAESTNRSTALTALKFRDGDQWPEDLKKGRKDLKKPCLTMNRTQRFVKAVVNDIRQVRPAIKTRPVDSQADPETSEILNGMIKAIEQSSNAEIAYDWATEYAVTMGWGYFRITCDYTDPETFEKDIIIKRVRNPFAVYLDPAHKEPDGSDSKYGFVIDTMSKEAFEAKYPGAQDEWEAGAKSYDGWFEKDAVRVAEYWELEEEKQKISMLEDGSIMWGEVEGAIQVRDSNRTTLIQRVMTGSEILEEKRYPWKYIPLIPVLGEEVDIEGKLTLKGMVQDLMDPARMYNYMRSVEVEGLGLTTKPKWVGPLGAFKNRKWRNSNTQNYPYLEWETDAVMKAGGQTPQYIEPTGLQPGVIQGVHTAAEELKAISGIHDPGLGDRSNEVSGVAIDSRKVQSDIANFHFVDNLARSMRHAGRVMVDMIPTVYSEERVVRILQPNGDEEEVTINTQGPYVDPKTQKERQFNLKVGRYDVVVDIGPSYATQRKEAVDSMIAMVKELPGAAQVTGDLIAKNMDWADSDEFAKRLKMLLPPGVAADENPQIKMMVQQYEQVISQGKEYTSYLESQLEALAKQLQDKQTDLGIKQDEVDRKRAKDQADYIVDMTGLEVQHDKNVPGSAV